MHLRAIKLRGFKSFPDSVEVRLEPDELAQDRVLISADRALLEVLPEERHPGVRSLAGDLEVDILWQELEARGARQLLVFGPCDESQQSLELVSLHTLLLQVSGSCVLDLTRRRRRGRGSP